MTDQSATCRQLFPDLANEIVAKMYTSLFKFGHYLEAGASCRRNSKHGIKDNEKSANAKSALGVRSWCLSHFVVSRAFLFRC
jgi:hypothetical protein